MTTKKTALLDFEKSLQELENLVTQMEKEELTLDESLKCFERGVELSRRCQTALQQAEQKVEKLIEKNGRIEIVPFEGQD